MIELSDLQQDALGEIINIGVGRAASGLSQLVQEEVKLSAPKVTVCTLANAKGALDRNSFAKFSSVSQRFSGPFHADAILLFPEHKALEIVRHMAGIFDISIEEFSEFEQEAMCEVGNIVLNACMSAFADMFHVELTSTLPTHHFGDADTVLDTSEMCAEIDEFYVLLLQVDMFLTDHRIQGHIVLLMGINSIGELLRFVEAYLSEHGLL